MVDNNQLVEIAYLNTDLELIKDLRNLINKKYSKIFHSVIVHGSIATNEVIPYSDFDGLLIVKDEFINSKQLIAFKRESMKAIQSFDPLQHHGWFQIKESDLLDFPESYLPISTLRHSKLIYPKVTNHELYLKFSKDLDYKKTLVNMLNQFERRENESWRPKNVYQLKSVLSQVMLIPCLYYSSIKNEGIFKRDSFEAVRSNFNEQEWMPIDTATTIRANWNYRMNGLQRLLFNQSNKLVRKIATRFCAPAIPENIQQKLGKEFYENLMLMVEKIKKDI
jgi:hypothetical protein